MNASARGTSVVRTDGMGPYRLGQRLKRLPWLAYLGEVYRARVRGSEEPALVLVRQVPGRVSARVDVRVEPGYLALGVRAAPDDLALVRSELRTAMRDADELLDVSLEREGVLEDLLSAKPATRAVQLAPSSAPAEPEPVMLQMPVAALSSAPAPRRTRTGWPRWSAAAAAAAAAAGIAAWLSPAPVNDQAETIVYIPVQRPSEVAWADVLTGASTPAPYTIERRLVVPDRPLEGQARPPCKAPSREVNGGCWVALDDRPPCPPKTAESRGKCWIPLPEDPDKKVPLGFGNQPIWR